VALNPAVYLLEAYATGDGREPVSAEALRADIEGRAGLRIIGLAVVPVDEAILCLLYADAPDAEPAVRAVADRYGAAARLLRVDWSPGPAG
jgi:hypothetical protein